VPRRLQSRNVPPTPFACTVSHAPPGQQALPAQQTFGPADAAQTMPSGAQQTPVVQAWPLAQVFPQAPQFAVLVCVSTQASEHGTSPDGQAHPPPEQLAPVAQACPQEPQLAASARVFTQAVGVPDGQGVGAEAGHAQAPPPQASPVSGHLDAQEPQWAGSESRFAQMGAGTSGGEQASGRDGGQVQVPASQTDPPRVQATSHAPQAPASPRRSRHSGSSAGQEVAPAWQLQAPPEQVPSAGHGGASVQAWTQEPQWSGSAWRSTQAPWQTTSAPGQRHVPETQVAPTGQTRPHTPQEAGLVWRSRQAPPQFVWPAGQDGSSLPLQAASARRRAVSGARRCTVPRVAQP